MVFNVQCRITKAIVALQKNIGRTLYPYSFLCAGLPLLRFPFFNQPAEKKGNGSRHRSGDIPSKRLFGR